MNDKILHPYSDEDELDTEEKQQLQAQRSLLQALLDDKRGILEELLRKRVLEDAYDAVHVYELRERLLLRNLEDEDLLEPIIDRLPRDDRLYLLEAIENNTFKDAAGEAVYSIGVELENASLTEIDKAEEDEDLCRLAHNPAETVEICVMSRNWRIYGTPSLSVMLA